MREFPRHPRWRGRYACRSDMLIFRCLLRFPHLHGSRAIQRDFGAVWRRIQPDTALICAGMGPTSSHSVSAPSAPSLPPCSLCQRPCRPPRCFGPSDDCHSACRCSWAIGTGNIQGRPACGFEAWPATRIKQGTGREGEIVKSLARGLAKAPANLNLTAYLPGLDFRFLLEIFKENNISRGPA